MILEWRLVRGREFSSRLIGWFGAGYYSHIDWVGPDGMLWGARSDVIGGVPAGVQIRPQHYDKWLRNTSYRLTVSKIQYDHYLSFMQKQLGKPYDTHGLIETYLLGRDWRSEDSWWCSELVAASCERSHVIPEQVGFRKITPGDCRLILADHGARAHEL